MCIIYCKLSSIYAALLLIIFQADIVPKGQEFAIFLLFSCVLGQNDWKIAF